MKVLFCLGGARNISREPVLNLAEYYLSRGKEARSH
ncbi:hypothetical protein J2W47_001497 [Priestia megaterium]|jgi:hypothetical protein|nr:hypothetical protein [Priestia megaterium]